MIQNSIVLNIFVGYCSIDYYESTSATRDNFQVGIVSSPMGFAVSFLKNGPTPGSFRLFSVFPNKQYNSHNKFLQQINAKNLQMSIQYTALGFEPMTFGT